VEQTFFERVEQLDDPSEPIAETNRRARDLAEELGIPRPSYERVRRHLRESRARQAERVLARELVLQLAYNTRPADAVVVDLLRILE
jgi:hypothetical protein